MQALTLLHEAHFPSTQQREGLHSTCGERKESPFSRHDGQSTFCDPVLHPPNGSPPTDRSPDSCGDEALAELGGSLGKSLAAQAVRVCKPDSQQPLRVVAQRKDPNWSMSAKMRSTSRDGDGRCLLCLNGKACWRSRTVILRVFREKELLVSQTPLSHATLRWCDDGENADIEGMRVARTCCSYLSCCA